MAQKSSGARHGTRKKLKKDEGSEGVIANRLQEFERDEEVVIDTDPAVQGGMPHPRFHGRTAEIVEERGDSYVVELRDGGKPKKLTVDPAHLSEVR
ncbi:MAG: 50S ribosomal protein L21e [Candidatus Nanohaloarchaea archaeon]|nr:50S ribosomal protein L21e [Candidatus Nanohaloarchaea archaeon]